MRTSGGGGKPQQRDWLGGQRFNGADGRDGLRDGDEVAAVEVLRILDPEHQEPFVSLGRLFLACSVTPLEGLLLFELDSLAYDVALGGLAPVPDIWVPLKTAREVADSLGRLDELAALLDWQTRRAWSVEDKEEGGLVHNWKISSDLIDPQDYSTASMLDTPFARIELLPPGSQVRTLLPPLASLPAFGLGEQEGSETWDLLWSRIVEWSVREYEGRKDRQEEEQEQEDLVGFVVERPALDSRDARARAGYDDLFAGTTPPATGDATNRCPLFFASTLSSLLALLQLVPPTPSSASDSPSLPSTRAQPALFSHLPHIPPLLRSSFASPSPPLSSISSDPSQKLYLLDALSRIFIHAYRSHFDSLARQRFEASMSESRMERDSRVDRRLLVGAAFVAGLTVGAAVMTASAAL
ncbi:hypothetical protein AAT19DRAFT_9992 [Rhodotorula toruloides]|uniref:Uncharacterized protein n=1 Tax=Rhodotorula toruloides TaxID=5286 RepID=A0A2T0A1I9_RHOTO|nr:hypothetical protein AAT19DRAFT_9992 [Rhodotorula toruloides]